MRARFGSFALLSCFFASIASAAVTGYVVNADGQPIAGAKVALLAPETAEARQTRLLSASPQRVALATGESSTTGKFSVEAPKDAPPVVDLRIEARGFAPESERVERDDDAGAIAIDTAVEKRGTITAAGKPVANATVIWSGGSGEVIATTDAAGRYAVPDPARWANRLVVLHPDFAIADETFSPFGGGRPQLDRVLNAGVSLSGRVVGEDGTTPVAKAEIVLGDFRLATSGDEGTFTIAHAPAKWETLTARTPTLLGVRARTASGPISIRLARPATITGTVRNAKTNAPLAGAEVRLTRIATIGRGETVASAFTDAKGNYALPPVAPGTFTAFALRPGFSSSPAPLTATAGQKVAKNLTATEEARVSGSVVDEEKRPIAGAVLSANEVTSDRTAMFLARAPNLRHEAISAPDGRFVIRAGADMDLQVAAAKKGMPAAKSATLRLAPGERKSNVVLTIPRGVALTGRVVDGDGKPLSGVAVEASQASGNNFGMMVRRIGGEIRRDRDPIRTASDGTFSLRLREGLYDVTFTREGFAQKQLRAQQVGASAKALEVTMEPGAEITGRVTRGGAGVEGVDVMAMDGASPFATTGADGSFRLADLTPGPVMVSFRKTDAFIQLMRNVTAPARDLTIELPAGGRITGRVFDKSSHNPITSFQAGINASRSGGGRMMVMPPQLRPFTSDDGSFVLENVPPGETQLVVNAAGYTTGRVPGLNVEDGKTIAGIEIGLETGTRLTGRVTNAEGQGISGALVRQGDGMPTMRMPEGTATTDANGEFTIESLEPGEKTFQISASGYLGESRTLTLSGRDARLDVQLSAGAKVSGIVVTEGGVPVADAQVYVRGVSGMSTRSARSDANGAFRLEGLAPGHYTFVAERPPYAQATVRDFDISGGAPLRIVMASGATIYGHVFGLTPAELSRTQVRAWVAGDDARAPVDASGNFRIEGAPAGSVRVMAETSAGMAGTSRNSPAKTIEVGSGASMQVDLEFRNDTTVRGRVTRNGRPLANAMVEFLPANGDSGTRVRAQSDNGGSYSVTGLEDGRYRVAVIDLERFSPYSTPYEVKGSGTFDIDIKVTSLRGRVTDSGTGQPIVEAKVELRAASTTTDFLGMRAAVTDGNGNFLLDSVSPGTYHLTASKSGYGNEIRDVTIGETAADSIELTLAANDGITLKVVDARDGRLLPAVVRAVDAQGRVAFETMSPFFGRDTAAAQKLTVAPGQYRVTIQAQGYATTTVTLTSPSQPTIGLTPGGTLVLRSSSSTPRTARLLDATGQPYQRSLLGNPPIVLAPSPAATTMTNLPPGAYTIEVLDESGKVTGSTKVTVVEGGTVEAAL